MILKNEQAMIDFGTKLAAELQAGDWLAIDGPLGAGKTVLCKAILRELGFTGEVASPSYAIVHQYDAPDVRIPVMHADLYRLGNIDDLEELGLDDARDDCITLVEWASNGGTYYANPSHRISITPLDHDMRRVELTRLNEEAV